MYSIKIRLIRSAIYAIWSQALFFFTNFLEISFYKFLKNENWYVRDSGLSSIVTDCESKISFCRQPLLIVKSYRVLFFVIGYYTLLMKFDWLEHPDFIFPNEKVYHIKKITNFHEFFRLFGELNSKFLPSYRITNSESHPPELFDLFTFHFGTSMLCECVHIFMQFISIKRMKRKSEKKKNASCRMNSSLPLFLFVLYFRVSYIFLRYNKGLT